MRRLVLIAALLLLAGCLEFEQQEIRVVYDVEHDRIDAQLVYRGLYSSSTQPWSLFGTAPEQEDVKNTEQQLDWLLERRPLFSLLDPMATYDLIKLRESKEPDAAALANLTAADCGDLFTAVDGRLCGWQHVRLRDVTRAFAILDEQWRETLAVPEHIKEWRALLGCEDDVSGALWKAALAKREPWYERRGAELLFHVPASEAAARRFAERVAQAPSLEALFEQKSRRERGGTRGDGGTEAPAVAGRGAPAQFAARRDEDRVPSDDESFAPLLRAAGITIRLREGGADLVLWDAASSVRTIDFKRPKSDEKRYDLAPHLAKRKVAPRTDVTDATLAQAFAEFRAH